MTGWGSRKNEVTTMNWINLSSSISKHPSIFDEDIRCPYCRENHKTDENGRLIGLEFIGTSTAGMNPELAKHQGADLAVKSKEATEFYKH